jgi:hypothetical protein
MFIMVSQKILILPLVVVVFSGVAVANSVSKEGTEKKSRKEIKQEIVRAYCWLLQII